MAEFGDALSTAITTENDGIPSIFEILAQENLNTSVRPAIKHIFKVLAQSTPHRFAFCYSWFDELYTVVECLIQHHFLSNNSASFAEHYYDLQRKSTPTPQPSEQPRFPLGKRIHFLSIASLTVFPYVQLKLVESYNTIREKYDLNGDRQMTLKQKIMLWCYPFVHLLWNATVLYYNFMFAVGKSDHHAPFYRALSVKLVAANPFDTTSDRSVFSRVFTKLLSGGVHIGIFAIQFIEWWYDENNDNSIKQVIRKSIPEPPTKTVERTNIPVPASGICPLCNRYRKNETALMTSGYVFCYVCIYKYVKANRRCPVTGYKTETNHLIKIYPPA